MAELICEVRVHSLELFTRSAGEDRYEEMTCDCGWSSGPTDRTGARTAGRDHLQGDLFRYFHCYRFAGATFRNPGFSPKGVRD